MSPTTGPYSTPGGTGATTGPYAVEVDLPVLVDQLRAALAAAPETSDPGVEPPIGSVVMDHGGVAWQRAEDGYWKTHTGRSNGWKYMTATFGPVTALAAAATPAPRAADAVLESIARWADAMRGQDWSVYPEQYGAGKSRAVEEIAQLLLPAPAPAAPVGEMSEDIVTANERLGEAVDAVAAIIRAHERAGMKHCGCARWAEIDPDATHSEHVARAIARALTGEATDA